MSDRLPGQILRWVTTLSILLFSSEKLNAETSEAFNCNFALTGNLLLMTAKGTDGEINYSTWKEYLEHKVQTSWLVELQLQIPVEHWTPDFTTDCLDTVCFKSNTVSTFRRFYGIQDDENWIVAIYNTIQCINCITTEGYFTVLSSSRERWFFF